MAFFPCNNGQYAPETFDVFNCYSNIGTFAMHYENDTVTSSMYSSVDAIMTCLKTNNSRQILAKQKCHVIGYRVGGSGMETFDADYNADQYITAYSASTGYFIILYAYPI